MDQQFNPSLIHVSKKQQFLKSFTEDEFRDQVVRPLYLLKGLEHGKDICGVDEDGKDCYLFGKDPIRGRILFAIQTKRGDLKMSADAKDNVLNAMTQMRTALNTVVRNAATKQKCKPDCVVLVASGEINKRAQEYIVDQIEDPRIHFADADSLIPEIDRLMPELWLGIDAKILPYLKNLRDHMIAQSDTIDISQLGIRSGVASPITDDTYVPLFLHRFTSLNKKKGGFRDKSPLEELPVQDVLKRHERLLLMTGDAGAGKTTSLRRLALLLIQQSMQSKVGMDIPIFLTAIEIVRAAGKLIETASAVASKLTPDSSPCFTKEDLEKGRVTMLIDGYDELANPDQRKTLIARLSEFHAPYKMCRIVITSRGYSFVQELLENLSFIRFNISPINYRQSEKMIQRIVRGKALPSTAIQEMLRRLESVHGVELNPLLVTVFVATSDFSRQDVPANITELFKKFTEMMLGRWDLSKGLSQQYQGPLKDFLLCRLAFDMHSRRVTTLPIEESRAALLTELKARGHEADIDVLFEEIVYRSGLLRVVDGELRFSHLLLQEFFAGRSNMTNEFLGSVVSDTWWMKALVFHFGEQPDNHAGLQALTQVVTGMSVRELHQTAISIGLVLQACYLTLVEHKIAVMRWVINALASTAKEFLECIKADRNETPNMAFLVYYMMGRDSVGAKVIRDVTDTVQREQEGKELTDLQQAQLFWCIVGLVESGQLDVAEELVKKFRPSDDRLLLGIFLGCIYVWKLQAATNEQRKIAEKICEQMSPRIDAIRTELLKEVRSTLLEVRSGKITAIEVGEDKQTPLLEDKSGEKRAER